MKLHCPKCHAEIATDDINIAKGMALCRACGEAFTPPAAAPGPPPGGVSVTAAPDGFTLRATLRHAVGLLALPGLLFWTAIFVLALSHEGGQIFQQFGLRFFIVLGLLALFFWGGALLLVFGHLSLTVRGDRAQVFMGIGPLGRTRTYFWTGAASAACERCFWGDYIRPLVLFVPTEQLVVRDRQGRKLVRFGALLTYKRRRYLAEALRHLLANPATEVQK